MQQRKEEHFQKYIDEELSDRPLQFRLNNQMRESQAQKFN